MKTIEITKEEFPRVLTYFIKKFGILGILAMLEVNRGTLMDKISNKDFTGEEYTILKRLMYSNLDCIRGYSRWKG